jgi:hypothetical protein
VALYGSSQMLQYTFLKQYCPKLCLDDYLKSFQNQQWPCNLVYYEYILCASQVSWDTKNIQITKVILFFNKNCVCSTTMLCKDFSRYPVLNIQPSSPSLETGTIITVCQSLGIWPYFQHTFMKSRKLCKKYCRQC